MPVSGIISEPPRVYLLYESLPAAAKEPEHGGHQLQRTGSIELTPALASDVRAADDGARERAGPARCAAERPLTDALMTCQSTQHPGRTRRQPVRKLIITLAALALSAALATPAQAADRQP